MNCPEILDALRQFTARNRVDFRPTETDAKPLSTYGPINQYVLALKDGSKPETAAEDLFVALCQDVLGFQQGGVGRDHPPIPRAVD